MTGLNGMTKEALTASGIFPNVDGPEELSETIDNIIQTWPVVASRMIYFAYALPRYNMGGGCKRRVGTIQMGWRTGPYVDHVFGDYDDGHVQDQT